MSNIKLWAKQNSPELLLGAAIGTSVIAVGSACVSTYKLTTKMLPEYKKRALELHNAVEALSNNPDVTPETIKKAKKDLTRFYIKTGGKIALYYAPSILSLALSIASMVGSHNIMRGRNIALATAFSSLKTSYDLYRSRVREKVGDKAEEALFKNVDVKKVTVKDKNGKTVTKEVDVPKENSNSDITQIMWGPDSELYEHTLEGANLTNLLRIEQVMNQKLTAEGIVWLSDVYRALGFSPKVLGKRRILASRVVGWKLDREDPNCNCYIDFGLHERNNRNKLTREAQEFQCGLRDYINLTFNWDGDLVTKDVIADKVTGIIMKKQG